MDRHNSLDKCLILSFFYCHSEVAPATEESPPPSFCHSDPERSEGEESPQETLRAKALRVTEEGVILSFFYCHSEVASATEESPQETLRAKALRVTEKGSF